MVEGAYFIGMLTYSFQLENVLVTIWPYAALKQQLPAEASPSLPSVIISHALGGMTAMGMKKGTSS